MKKTLEDKIKEVILNSDITKISNKSIRENFNLDEFRDSKETLECVTEFDLDCIFSHDKIMTPEELKQKFCEFVDKFPLVYIIVVLGMQVTIFHYTNVQGWFPKKIRKLWIKLKK